MQTSSFYTLPRQVGQKDSRPRYTRKFRKLSQRNNTNGQDAWHPLCKLSWASFTKGRMLSISLADTKPLRLSVFKEIMTQIRQASNGILII